MKKLSLLFILLIPLWGMGASKCPLKIICTNIGEQACLVISNDHWNLQSSNTIVPKTYNFASAHISSAGKINCLFYTDDHRNMMQLSKMS